MGKYTIGVDYGTLSGRAVLVDVSNGAEVATASFPYPHAVMDKTLPSGHVLPLQYALQHPRDYVDVLTNTIPVIIRESGIDAMDIVGIGTDFTACTVLPVKADGTPLCFLKEYEDEPHAYVKLWKHHAAQDKANRINEIANLRQEPFIKRYGGKISSEWLFPKLWQILEEAPNVYDAMDYFIEAADWIVWQLTGVQSRNACTAGYKAMWNKKDGYPSTDYFKALSPKLEHVVEEKLNCKITPIGERAGYLCKEMAEKLGLSDTVAVCIGNVDAHVTVPAVGIDSSKKILAIMGTSTCHVLLGDTEEVVPGMCGVVEDGIYPGFFGYEAGQSCVGDHFEWFVKQLVPARYQEEAKDKNVSIYQLLKEKSKQLQVGQSGLVALDWWNGNRSVLVDVDLTGLIVGLTLQTKPEEIYRALIEATAYGNRKIVETFRSNGVDIEEFYASGGISQKDELTMQIYADVLDMPIKIGDSLQGPAVGSSIFAAVAAGIYKDVFVAAGKMGRVKDKVYFPIKENVAIYNRLYAEYEILHDYFARGENDVMKRLLTIKREVKRGNMQM